MCAGRGGRSDSTLLGTLRARGSRVFRLADQVGCHAADERKTHTDDSHLGLEDSETEWRTLGSFFFTTVVF